MVEQINIEKYLSLLASNVTGSVSLKTTELALKDYPTKGAFDLLFSIKEISNALYEEVILLQQRTLEMNLSREERTSCISLPIWSTQYLHQMLDYVENADLSSTPHGIAAPFYILAQKLEKNTQIILRAQWDYMYSLLDIAVQLRDVISKSLPDYYPDRIRDFPDWLLVLSYPATHKENGLLHVLQAHEVGHFFDTICNISSYILEEIDPERLGLENLVDSLAKREVGEVLHPDLFYHAALETSRGHIRRRLIQLIKNWVQEIIADAFAIRVAGPAYFFALAEFCLSVSPLTVSDDDHPSPIFRLNQLIQDINELGYSEILPDDIKEHIKNWALFLSEFEVDEEDILEKALSMESPGVGNKIREAVNKEVTNKGLNLTPQMLSEELTPLTSLIDALIPPIEIVDSVKNCTRPVNVFSIFNAGWVCYLTKLDNLAEKFGGGIAEANKIEIVKIINQHILKAIEVNQLCLNLSQLKEEPKGSCPLFSYLYDSSTPIDQRLVIVPIINEAEQIKGYSVDLRLGSEFILPVRSRFPVLDPDEGASNSRYASGDVERYQERVYRPYGQPFVLNPGELVLGCTLEYIQLPANMTGYITGRSSWGRLGLNIATAIAVAPGYSGVLTLELVNHSNAPLMLYPGTRIASLNLSILPKRVGTYVERSISKYRFPTYVEYSKIREDKDWSNLKSIIRPEYPD